MYRKKLSLLLLAVTSLFAHDLSAQTSNETVNVLEPGTLRELVNELPSPRLKNLTINGSLNGKDIAYLVGGTGKMVSIDTLDISKVALVGDDEPYKQLLVETSDIGFGSTTEIYYLSEKDTIIYEGNSTGMGGYVGVRHVYCKDLSGAFAENSSFKRILMPENLTKVGNYQFFKNTSVSSVELPQNATKFGERAFDGASALTALRIPDGVVTIPQRSVRCTSLEAVELPASVDSIYNQAFEGAPIKHIDLKNIRYVGYSAFSGNKLTGILDISSVDYIGRSAFYGTNTIEAILFSSQLKDIPANAFSGAGVSSLELPSSIETIGSAAFYGCERLSTVVLSPNIVNIDSNSFGNTPWLNNLKGDNGVIYAGTIALAYDYSYHLPQDGAFSFREGTVAIANTDGYWGFFPTSQDNWHLEKVSLPASLMRIGNNAFRNCRTLNEINIPEGLLEIGSSAFAGCESLPSINLPEGITEISNGTFDSCKELQEFVFPHNLTRIGEGAFSNATNMYFSELPSSLKVIESGAFSDCKSIPSVILPENLDSIYPGAFYGCTGIETIRVNSKELNSAAEIFQRHNSLVTNNENNLYQVIVGPNVSVLPDKMFFRCSKLEKVKFEDIQSSELKKIGNDCFRECSQLSFTELPSSLDSIGAGAFFRTPGYQGVLNTNNISYIGGSAFEETNGITELIISTPRIIIGNAAFAGCSNLESVTILSESIEYEDSEYFYPPFRGNGTRGYVKKVVIGSRLNSIPKFFFSNISTIDSLIFIERGTVEKAKTFDVGKGAFERCWLSGSLSLPEGTVNIGESAFAYNYLSEIVIPNTCKEIAYGAFSNNEYVYNISLGDGVEVIGEYAFAGNRNLISMTIPTSCKEIGRYFINGCSAMESLYFLSKTPPAFGGDLAYAARPIIFVPYTSLEQYREVPQLNGYTIKAIPSSIIPVESISLSPNIWNGIEGESFRIEATVLPENATDKTLTWTSSDEAIATVNDEGFVIVHKNGECVIIATANDGSGIKAECLISSTSAVDGINTESDYVDILTLDGQTVRKHCSPDAINSLANGIYLIRQGDRVKKLVIH